MAVQLRHAVADVPSKSGQAGENQTKAENSSVIRHLPSISVKSLNRHTITEHLRIRDLIKYNGINSHRYVIFCDNRLRCKIHYLLFQIHSSCHTVKNRNLKVKSGSPCCLICPQSFNNQCLRLSDYLYTGNHHADNNR